MDTWKTERLGGGKEGRLLQPFVQITHPSKSPRRREGEAPAEPLPQDCRDTAGHPPVPIPLAADTSRRVNLCPHPRGDLRP